jgi:hypothetical protein
MPKTKDGSPGTRERRILESESRWLQKALFALSKAENDRERLAKERSEKVEPLTVQIEGESFELETVREAISDAVLERVEDLRITLNRSRALIR